MRANTADKDSLGKGSEGKRETFSLDPIHPISSSNRGDNAAKKSAKAGTQKFPNFFSGQKSKRGGLNVRAYWNWRTE